MDDEQAESFEGKSAKVVHSPVSAQKKKKEQKKQLQVSEQRMNAFDFRRRAVTSKLQRIRETLERGDAITVHHLETFLRRIDSCYDEYNIIQNEVYTELPDQRAEQESHFIAFESFYEELRVSICATLENVRARQITVAPKIAIPENGEQIQPLIVNQPVGLPNVPLPSFDGTYERWFRFKQLFLDLMQKHHHLSDATKLHYLTQSLKGKAENIFSEQILNENNFQAAWRLLEERFENKRTIIDIHVGGLLNLRKIHRESASELRQLVEECSRHVDALEFHDQPMQGMSEQLVISLLTSKLDKSTIGHWEDTIKPKQLPNYKQTIEFLQNRCFVLERCEANNASRQSDMNKQKGPLSISRTPIVKVHAALQTTEQVCVICGESHNVNKCNVFQQMTVLEKTAAVKDKQLCFNCLRRGHRVGQCKARRCMIAGCGKKHHTQLHYERQTVGETTYSESSETAQKVEANNQLSSSNLTTPPTATVLMSRDVGNKQVILSTAIVNAKNIHGAYYPCRVLLDSGSQSNFLSEHMANILQLKRKAVRVPVIGINNEKLVATQQTIAEITSNYEKSSWIGEFLIVPQVTGILPQQKIDTHQWNVPREINLADPKFNIPAKVDMLVGAELFFGLLTTERLQLESDQPMLWKSKLGWIVCGSYRSFPRTVLVSAVSSNLHEAEDNLEVIVQRFWQLEDIPDVPIVNIENQQCIQHFATTHRRENGRFVVRLPFRDSVLQLGNSRRLAERRFLQLERRLNQHPALKSQYAAFIDEYQVLGHCRAVTKDDGGFYLPHHAILKPSSSTTKLRVVFDASARSDTNLSLNDVLIPGPTVQDSLMAIVLRFRKYRYVFTADIIQMFRQIRVDDRDTPYQKILWRKNVNDELHTLELTTVTYGTSCAPFCATMCLRQLADDEEMNFPLAANVARNDFYMDDVLSGADELQLVLDSQTQLIALLNRGGFQLHKWCANVPQLLEKIPESKREVQAAIKEHDSNGVIKTLGILWEPRNDIFLFDIRVSDDSVDYYTKRIVLSDVAKIFDPLGFLGPVIIVAKLFIQELWASGVNWDDRLTAEQERRWRSFKHGLQNINDLKIPRHAIAEDSSYLEIHGFSDASKKAYGACVYLRSVKQDGTAAMHLLSSKTRVAPLPKKQQGKRSSQPFTIPKAELCAANLLARLATSVIESMRLKLKEVVLWCDSQIVLCWLNKSPSSLDVFVGNKVREIHQLTKDYNWRYVRTNDNPADLASRGISTPELVVSDLWWSGPEISQISHSVSQHDTVRFSDEELEIQDTVYSHISLQEESNELLTKFSDFRKLQRVCAYILRFVKNCRVKERADRAVGLLTVAELRQATQRIIAKTQQEGFAKELEMLKRGEMKKNQLLPLAPFIDGDGLLRVGGRLRHAKIPFGKRHQLLLPRSHHVTKLLITSLHKEHLHVGQQGLLAIVRQRYWPVRAKSVIRQVIKNCVQCFRMRPPEVTQFMGELPACRVNPSPVFSKTGVDYAGPFLIRQGLRRPTKVKTYVALFICMSTKAIHLELVSDLTSEAFVAALQRFVGRRGYPEQMMSDNATNFRGAHSQLHELYELFQSQQANETISRFCSSREIYWSFIPPRSPNFGGIWEAGIKAAKSHLKIILCNAFLSYEEMNTVLVQIEAVLNSRPLTQLSTDANDLGALTPGHFLVGHELSAVPEPSYKELKVSSLSRWQYLQKLKQDFWSRWSAEYLSELQPRSKWYKNKLIIRPGMLVVLKEDNIAPQQWRLGRITEVHEGVDQLVRAVKVRTANGEVCRGVSKISILPIEDNEIN